MKRNRRQHKNIEFLREEEFDLSCVGCLFHLVFEDLPGFEVAFGDRGEEGFSCWVEGVEVGIDEGGADAGDAFVDEGAGVE